MIENDMKKTKASLYISDWSSRRYSYTLRGHYLGEMECEDGSGNRLKSGADLYTLCCTTKTKKIMQMI